MQNVACGNGSDKHHPGEEKTQFRFCKSRWEQLWRLFYLYQWNEGVPDSSSGGCQILKKRCFGENGTVTTKYRHRI